MFHPNPMDRVELMILKSDLPEVSRALAKGRILHLRPVDRQRLPSRPIEDEPATERVRALSEVLHALIRDLDLEGEKPEELLSIEDFSLWESWANDLSAFVRRILDRREEVSRKLRSLKQLEAFLSLMNGLEGDFSELASLRHARLLTGLLPVAAEKKLPVNTLPGLVFFPWRSERELLVAILTASGYSAGLEKLLTGLDFQPQPLSQTISGSFDEVRQRVLQTQSRILKYISTLDGRLAGLREEHRKHLALRHLAVSAELSLREAENAFGFTRRVVMLGGWLPRLKYRELKNLLTAVCPGRFVLRRLAAKGDDTPVQLANPRLLRPFQKILAIYGTPLYGEVEPTPLLGVGFLVLFGMMFADVGQGAVLAAAGIGMRRYTRFREEGLLLAEVGCSAALFGVLFGSVFGLEELLPALWFSPFQNIPYLMAVALALGVFLIFSGLLLHIRNLWGRVSRVELLTDPFGVSGALFYGGAVCMFPLVYLGLIPPIALSWLLVPLGCIFSHPFVAGEEGRQEKLSLRVVEGLIETMDTVLRYLMNTLSFLRVGAFGLAHVGLSYAVFTLADLVRDLPLGQLWVVLICFFGNLVIIALEGLVVSIQAVRLQFYEFFTKFFQGGGIPYSPLALDSERRR